MLIRHGLLNAHPTPKINTPYIMHRWISHFDDLLIESLNAVRNKAANVPHYRNQFMPYNQKNKFFLPFRFLLFSNIFLMKLFFIHPNILTIIKIMQINLILIISCFITYLNYWSIDIKLFLIGIYDRGGIEIKKLY